jgi:prepilin-type N-terminal cleavage/methylation domain-containing protein
MAQRPLAELSKSVLGQSPTASTGRGVWGFTLVELITVMALVAVFSLVLGRLLLSGVDAFQFATSRKEALREARIALNAVSRELRQIRNTSSILQAGQRSVTFVTIDNEEVTLTLVGELLLRNDVPVARHVSSFRLEYFDQDGHLLSTPVQDREKIRAIRVSVRVAVEGKEVELHTQVRPRNL